MEIVQSWSQITSGAVSLPVEGVTPGNTLIAAVSFTDGRSGAAGNPPAFDGAPFVSRAAQSGGLDTRPSTAIYSFAAIASSGTVAQVDRPGTTRFNLYEVSGLGAFIGGATSPADGFVGPTSIALAVANGTPSAGFLIASAGFTAIPSFSGWSEGFTALYPETIGTTSRGYGIWYRETPTDQTVTGTIEGAYLGVSFAVFENLQPAAERQRSRLILTPW